MYNFKYIVMEKRILFVLALFFVLTGFNGESRIVEQREYYLQVNEVEGIAPSAVEKPKIIPSEDGSCVKFEIRIKARPKPTVTWYRGTTVVKDNSRIKTTMKEIGENLYLIVLEIKDVIATDGGEYKAVIKNDFGEMSFTLHLNWQ